MPAPDQVDMRAHPRLEPAEVIRGSAAGTRLPARGDSGSCESQRQPRGRSLGAGTANHLHAFEKGSQPAWRAVFAPAASRRARSHSSSSTWIVPATGIAPSAPSTPASFAPISTAIRIASGDSCTVRL